MALGPLIHAATLVCLNVRNTGCSDAAALWLAEQFQHPTNHLAELHLERNHIQSEAAMSLIRESLKRSDAVRLNLDMTLLNEDEMKEAHRACSGTGVHLMARERWYNPADKMARM